VKVFEKTKILQNKNYNLAISIPNEDVRIKIRLINLPKEIDPNNIQSVFIINLKKLLDISILL